MLRADWIRPKNNMGEVCPVFLKKFNLNSNVKNATLIISARGVYTAELNGIRVGDFVLAPGWTQYDVRIQYQTYDVTELLTDNNEIKITLADGWYKGRIKDNFLEEYYTSLFPERECAVIAEIAVKYLDGTEDIIKTDESWYCGESNIRFCDIYDGEIYDASFDARIDERTVIADNNDKSVLIEQVGEKICEQERFKPLSLITTPKGEKVLDFGQNLTGYLEFSVNASKGDVADFSFAEILDKDGNFYTGNYRSAKCLYRYICKDGEQRHKPTHTFYGFRYVRINEFPEKDIDLNNFTAIVVHSELKRTGRLTSSDPLLNKLFHNVIWGQKSNYLDVPTDCPQRDERLGWTGDTEIFMKTACYNYDVRRFFKKWLGDLRIAQSLNKFGAVPSIVPVSNVTNSGGAAWGDAVTVCPTELYLMYGDKDDLKENFAAMKKWVDFITDNSSRKGLWIGGQHYGDWLELAAPYGAYKGETRDDLVASAFYAYSTSLVIKAGEVLGEDVTEYKNLYKTIREEFIKEFDGTYNTQTEYILSLWFDLAKDPEKTADELVNKIHRDGDKMQTGFVGTPYLLHVLSKFGYNELAYKLLLKKNYPSWLYPVTMGATTMWEHWDGITPDGKLWPDKMNSYNHYAYGSVCDWIYSVAAGINPVFEKPGFEQVLFKPTPTDMIDSLNAELDTDYGKIISYWYHKDGKIVYEITTPTDAKAVINGEIHRLKPGKYVF